MVLVYITSQVVLWIGVCRNGAVMAVSADVFLQST